MCIHIYIRSSQPSAPSGATPGRPIYLSLSLSLSIYIYIYIYIYISIYIYICIYVNLHHSLYIYIYIHTHIHVCMYISSPRRISAGRRKPQKVPSAQGNAGHRRIKS